MFAVYDGHGGDDCCNFLKEQFHTYALENFSSKNMENNLKKSSLRLDKDFADKIMREKSGDTSGSCALSLILLDDKLVFMNIGDSRAFYSKNRGKELQIASYDHKPHFFSEMQRIFKNNGQLYRVCSNRATGQTEIYYASNHQEFLQIDRIPEEGNERIFGPWRVKPGGLSVSHSLIL